MAPACDCEAPDVLAASRGHARHAEARDVAMYVPAEQFWQLVPVKPVVKFWNDPGEHAAHAEPPP